jgi:pimeloyl-ACP methyl ester carboxylesterase
MVVGDASPSEVLRNLPVAFPFVLFFAVFIGALAMPVYVIVFLVWLLAAKRFPDLERSCARVILLSGALGAPVALTVTLSYSWTPPFPFAWDQAAVIFPIALVSCWGAVALPRLLFTWLGFEHPELGGTVRRA